MDETTETKAEVTVAPEQQRYDRYNLNRPILLGAAAYVLGALMFVIGLVAGVNRYSDLNPRSYDAWNYLFAVIFTGGVFPSAGTVFVFFVVDLVLRRILRQSPNANLYANVVAMLVAVGLTFAAGMYMAYNYARTGTY